MSNRCTGLSISIEQFEIVYLIRQIGAILSICSSIFLIVLYVLLSAKTRCKKKRKSNLLQNLMENKEQPGSFSENNEPINTSVNRWASRKGKNQLRIGLGNDLLLGYALSSIIYSSSLLIKVYYSEDEIVSDEFSTLCQVQAFLKTFGGLSLYTWIFCVSHSFLLSVNLTNFQKIKIYSLIYLAISFVLPLIISVIPLFMNEYGWGISSCGFNLYSSDGTRLKVLQSIVFTYNFLFLIFQVVCSFKVHIYFSERFKEISNDPSKINEIKFIKQYRILIWVVPVVMLIFVSTSIYNAFTDMLGYYKEYFLNGHNILISLSSFVMSIVFVFYFRQVLPLIFCFHKNKQDDKPSSINELKGVENDVDNTI